MKTTFNCGDLVPVYIDEVLPGDTFEMNMQFLSRLSTPIFPTMDDIKLEFYAFFVPNRLVWDGWEELNGENKTGAWTPSEEPALVPAYGGVGIAEDLRFIPSRSIADYMGVPVGMDLENVTLSALPFRGYALIWNEWFRDENLQAPVVLDKGSDPSTRKDSYSPVKPLFKVNKFHDYFTSALPAPQKGDSPLIPIELNELIPVITGDTRAPGVAPDLRFNSSSGGSFPDTIESYHLGITPGLSTSSASTSISTSDTHSGGTSYGVYPSNLWADGRGMVINSSTISELRTAFQIQKLFEKDARGGKLLCLHVKKIAEKIWKALFELIRGEGFCQPQRIVSEII